jgi:hypothetical protein
MIHSEKIKPNFNTFEMPKHNSGKNKIVCGRKICGRILYLTDTPDGNIFYSEKSNTFFFINFSVLLHSALVISVGIEN